MRRVEWSEIALAQYKSAIDYLSERNPDAAQSLADRIRAALDGLAKRPIGRPGMRAGTYEKPVLHTPYILVYSLIGEGEGALRVWRVFHSSQNWTPWAPEPDEKT